MWKLYLVSSVIQEMAFNETKRSQMGLCSNIYMWFVFLLLQTMHQHMQSTLEVTVLHLISSDARRHNNPSFATETAFASNTAHPLQMVIRLHSSAQAFWHFEWDSSWKKSQTTTCYLWNSLKNGIFFYIFLHQLVKAGFLPATIWQPTQTSSTVFSREKMLQI